MRARLARVLGVDRHQRPLAPVASDRRLDRAAARLRAAVDQRAVLASQLPLRQQLLERAMHRIALGHHQQSGGVPVEPMHDSRSPRFLPAGAAADQGLRERAGAMTAGGMHHHARRLVDDHQVLVLVGHRERNVDLGLRLGQRRVLAHLHPLPGGNGVALGPLLPVDLDAPGLDQVLGSGA